MGLFFNNKIFASPFNEKLPQNHNKKPSKPKASAIRNLMVKANGLLKAVNDSRDYSSYPEYDLNEIRMAIEHDSYAKQSVMKYSYLFLKAGYQIKSDNEEASKYIKQRFHLMSFCTKKPIDILIQEVGDDLIKYSNAFLVKSRTIIDPSILKAKGYLNPKPVGGYFRIDPTCVSIQRDKFGNVQKYIQHIEDQTKEFSPNDIIHFYMDKEAKNAFGTPRMTAAIEDIKILRKIEGNVMAMIYRFSMPLFQWIIGLPQEGYQATQREIDEAKRTVEDMPLDGSIVTNEKTKINVVGSDGVALDATNYLQYFEKRVLAALDLSESQLGRGGNNNADTMESQVHNVVKYYQRIISIFIDNFIIDELLLEGGFNPIMNPEDETHMVFNEIDIDTRVKLENHEMAKYQANMITFPEMRRAINMRDTNEREQLYKNAVDLPYEKDMNRVKTASSIEILKAGNKYKTGAGESANNSTSVKGGKSVSPKGNGTIKLTKNKDIANKNMPANQHGVTSVKLKESLIETDKKKDKAKFKRIYDMYYSLDRDIRKNSNNKDVLFSLYKEKISNAILTEVKTFAENGILKFEREISKINGNKTKESINYSLDAFELQINSDISKLFTDINKKLETETDIDSVFKVFEYRIRFILEFIPQKSYWYAYLKAGQSYGFKQAHIKFNSDEDKKKFPSIISLIDIHYEEIPPFHPFCGCEVYFMKGDDN